jgi:hypothetical protein
MSAEGFPGGTGPSLLCSKLIHLVPNPRRLSCRYLPSARALGVSPTTTNPLFHGAILKRDSRGLLWSRIAGACKSLRSSVSWNSALRRGAGARALQ